MYRWFIKFFTSDRCTFLVGHIIGARHSTPSDTRNSCYSSNLLLFILYFSELLCFGAEGKTSSWMMGCFVVQWLSLPQWNFCQYVNMNLVNISALRICCFRIKITYYMAVFMNLLFILRLVKKIKQMYTHYIQLTIISFRAINKQ